MPEQQSKPKAQNRKRRVLSDQERAQREALKASKFRELGEARMGKALNALRQVERLGNRATYTYTPDQAAKIKQAIADALERIARAFEGQESAPSVFTF